MSCLVSDSSVTGSVIPNIINYKETYVRRLHLVTLPSPIVYVPRIMRPIEIRTFPLLWNYGITLQSSLLSTAVKTPFISVVPISVSCTQRVPSTGTTVSLYVPPDGSVVIVVPMNTFPFTMSEHVVVLPYITVPLNVLILILS